VASGLGLGDLYVNCKAERLLKCLDSDTMFFHEAAVASQVNDRFANVGLSRLLVYRHKSHQSRNLG
jgi:hypothetical protein